MPNLVTLTCIDAIVGREGAVVDELGALEDLAIPFCVRKLVEAVLEVNTSKHFTVPTYLQNISA